MPAISSALIIGGGIAGMSAAICLREIGVDVHLIDIDPEWKVYGAGITITGPTLRVMKRLGILDSILKDGFVADGVLALDPQGGLIAEIETGVDDNEIPGAGGILRPALHRILRDRLMALAPEVSLGVQAKSISPGSPKVVQFSDGASGIYDLVIGADGIFSTTRTTLFGDALAPQYVGQVCWRLMTIKHKQINRRTYFLGGPCKVGMNPVSADLMYMFLLEPMTAFQRLPDALLHVRLAELMGPFGGPIADARAELGPNSNIVARPLETIFLPSPWYRDGTLLIGDAAHATTPQLASGAGMAMEDGVVLAECIAQARTLDEAFATFMARRWARCALVVNSSLKLGELERSGASPIDQVRIVETALRELNQAF
ncbi:MAG: monooxygenase [Rhizobiales bacterium 62-17]|nr:FAD-dependent monooxygenase [Hyphomicrobiales bacterium]OJY02144.1 MAG: monooxygenase [Rhizobiales bacterium 62-17]